MSKLKLLVRRSAAIQHMSVQTHSCWLPTPADVTSNQNPHRYIVHDAIVSGPPARMMCILHALDSGYLLPVLVWTADMKWSARCAAVGAYSRQQYNVNIPFHFCSIFTKQLDCSTVHTTKMVVPFYVKTKW